MPSMHEFVIEIVDMNFFHKAYLLKANCHSTKQAMKAECMYINNNVMLLKMDF